MRADAQRNREKILKAAEDLVARKGTAASVADIVEAAGVGPPTLYRQFGSKEELLKIVHERHAETVVTWFTRARAEPTGRDGLQLVIDLLLRESRDNAAVREWPGSLAGTKLERLIRNGWAELIERAREDGSIRADFFPTDAPYFIYALLEVARTVAYDPALQDRYVALLLEGLRPDPERALPGRPPSARKLRETRRRVVDRQR